MCGYLPRHFGLTSLESCSAPGLDQWVQDRKVMTDLICMHLYRVVTHMKHWVDKGRSEHQFDVGDLVFLKPQHYVQSSFAPRAN
jgi:hypothetical protein